MNENSKKVVKLPRRLSEEIQERTDGLSQWKYGLLFNEEGEFQILQTEGTSVKEEDIKIFGSDALKNKTITGMSSISKVEYTGSPHCEIIEINIHGQTVWFRICYD